MFLIRASVTTESNICCRFLKMDWFCQFFLVFQNSILLVFHGHIKDIGDIRDISQLCNRIARELKVRLEKLEFFRALPPADKDELVYQESRRIVIAEVGFAINLIFSPHFLPVPKHRLQRVSSPCGRLKDDERVSA